MTDWAKVKHFVREEFKHDPDKVAADVVYLLDEMRDAHGGIVQGVRYIIHAAWDSSGHVTDSGHYADVRPEAVAVDFHMRAGGTVLPLVDQWLWAERFPWMGIGLYPFWRQPGLHVDLRRVGRDHEHLGRRWWRDLDGQYKALDRDCLKLITKEE